MNNIDFLKNVPIFAGLDQRDVAELAGRMGQRAFAKTSCAT
jgi:hypothetical protein